MNKILVGIALLGIALLTFGGVGYVYAQTQTPPEPPYPYGPGMMGGYRGYGHGMMGFGHGWMGFDGGEGPMHQSMVSALAGALDLSVEEIESRHDAGETLWEIASAEGLSDEEIREVLDAAHDSALDDAVANGWLTEDQAEWMDEHMDGMWDYEGDFGGFGGHCGSGWRYNDTTVESGISY
jgi:hypothetical protein